jgi:peptide/nickel transport system substrate-binding protein
MRSTLGSTTSSASSRRLRQPINSLAAPNDPWFADTERLSMKYPFDPRMADQNMTQAGFTKGPDGVYTSPQFGKFNIELWTLDGTQNVQELQILGDLWKQQGFEMTQHVVPPAQVQNNEVRSTFPGLSSTSAGTVVSFTQAMIGGPNNRWQGSNFGGWPGNADYESWIDKFNTTLDRPARYLALAQASKILTEDVSTLPLLYNPQVIAFRNVLSGVKAPLTGYNIHEWTMK